MHRPNAHYHPILKNMATAILVTVFHSSLAVASEDEAAREAAREAAQAKARVEAAAKAKAAQAALEGWEMGPFVKHPEPVLKPNPESVFDCPIMGKGIRWEEMNTYNPAAVVKDGKVYLLYRADGRNPECGWGRVCRIGLATSEDGIHFKRHPEPVLYPDNDGFKQYEWAGGCEDLHVIEGEDGTYYMNYTTHTSRHADKYQDTMSIATSRDLVNWTKHGPGLLKFNPEKVNGSRSGVVVSRRVGDKLIAAKIEGKYWMFYTHGCVLAWSDDLINWHWAGKVGWPRGAEAGAIALLRDDGILLMGQTGAGPLGGWCLWQQLHNRANLSLQPISGNPILKEQPEPFLWPEREWEIKGMTGYTTVSNALVPFKGKWFLYYGAADTYTGVATCPIRE
jgi:predicted GH43/DUF377 family glycosyl hydrolase